MESNNINPKGLAQVVEALVLRFAPFKVQGSTPYGCKQSLGATPLGETLVIWPVLCRKTSEDAVHETEVYFVGVGPKSPALERFPNIKKKKKKKKET